jgi:hypothetical protein
LSIAGKIPVNPGRIEPAFLFNSGELLMKTPNWRVVTNRANAEHSTGPKTPEGKAVASRNATKHSLTSKQVVIPGEDPAEYETHRGDLVAALKPANALESELVEELAASSWRLKRAHRIETAVLAEIAAGSPDPDAAIAKSFLERPKELDRLVRYMTSIERAYWRVFDKLEAIQCARREQEYQAAIEESYRQSLKQSKQRPEQASGFVSQTPEDVAAGESIPRVLVAGAGQSLHPELTFTAA